MSTGIYRQNVTPTEESAPRIFKLLVIGTIYRPPSSSVEFYTLLRNSLETWSMSTPKSELFLLGDTNIDTSQPCSSAVKHMDNLSQEFQLQQVIDKPNRVHQHSSSIIDHVYCSDMHRVSDYGVVHSTISDHYAVFCTRKARRTKSVSKYVTSRKFTNFQEDSFLTDLRALNWDSVLQATRVEEAWSLFKSLFITVSDVHAPYISKRTKTAQPKWLTPDIKSLMQVRDDTKARARRTGESKDWEDYKAKRNYVNKRVRLAKASYCQQKLEENLTDSKKLWATIKEVLPKKTQAVTKSLRWEGKHILDLPNIANCLNKFFVTVGNKLAEKFKHQATVPTCPARYKELKTTFNFKQISEVGVYEKLRGLHSNKATGLDRIHARLLKVAAPSICKPLTHIFNLSLSSGNIPTDWKMARVTPLHKGGDTEDPNNYRPISVLPVIMKAFEREVHTQFVEYLHQHNILSTQQSGFRTGHSTTTTLLDAKDYVLHNMDRGNLVGAVFLDLKKAFDTVHHGLLLTKLSWIGIQGVEHLWFSNYLSGRQQIVSLNGCRSEYLPVTLGVPQGSILGPLLFNLFINDIPDVVTTCKICLYADDTAIFYPSNNVKHIESILNYELSGLATWFQTNRLTLNVTKTKWMLFGTANRLKQAQSLTVEIDQEIIERVHTFKYLGMYLDSHLSFNEHIDKVCSKVSQRIGLLRRLRHCLTFSIADMLYKTMILPIFDYCDTVWGTCGATKQRQLQILQNRAARVVLQRRQRDISIVNLHQTLNWKYLADRRFEHTCIMVFKCLTGLAPTYLSATFQHNSRIHTYNTRQTTKLHPPSYTTTCGQKTFAYTGTSQYNKLADNIRNITTLKGFKTALKNTCISDLK